MLLLLRFARFLTFFRHPKSLYFLLFCHVSYVFSNYNIVYSQGSHFLELSVVVYRACCREL